MDGGLYRQVMVDLASYAEALMLAKPSTPVQSIFTRVDKIQQILNQHRWDSWARQLNGAMMVKCGHACPSQG